MQFFFRKMLDFLQYPLLSWYFVSWMKISCFTEKGLFFRSIIRVNNQKASYLSFLYSKWHKAADYRYKIAFTELYLAVSFFLKKRKNSIFIKNLGKSISDNRKGDIRHIITCASCENREYAGKIVFTY